MSSYKFERLSAQDNSFLFAETPNAPLHVAAVGIYDNGGLALGRGGIDFRKIKQALEASDLVLLGDVLDYDFADLTETWRQTLEELAERFAGNE